MTELDDILTAHEPQAATGSNQDFDKEAWAAKKTEERNNVYERIDALTEKIKEDPSFFLAYLNMQSRFDRYSVSNALLILDQKPDALRLRDFNAWKEDGFSVKKGATGISILERGDEFQKSDGTTGYSYNVKKLFDISQTDCDPTPEKRYDDRSVVKALTEFSKVPFVISNKLGEGVNAYFDADKTIIYVRQGLAAKEIVSAVSREVALSLADMKSPGYEREDHLFGAECVSYMVCKRFGMDTPFEDANYVGEEFKYSDNSDIRTALSTSKQMASDIIQRMTRSLEQQKGSKTQEEAR